MNKYIQINKNSHFSDTYLLDVENIQFNRQLTMYSSIDIKIHNMLELADPSADSNIFYYTPTKDYSWTDTNHLYSFKLLIVQIKIIIGLNMKIYYKYKRYGIILTCFEILIHSLLGLISFLIFNTNICLYKIHNYKLIIICIILLHCINIIINFIKKRQNFNTLSTQHKNITNNWIFLINKICNFIDNVKLHTNIMIAWTNFIQDYNNLLELTPLIKIYANANFNNKFI